MEKFARAPVGKRCRGGIVMRSIMPSECVMLTRVAVDCRVRFFGKRRFDLGLRRLGDELVLLGQMHQHGCMKPVDLAQIFLSITAVIDDRSIAPYRTAARKVISPPRQ